jgi:hypothetical protein
MTPEGKAYTIMRLSEAPDMAALRRVWESLSKEYQNVPAIKAHKEAMKEALNGQR